jgi:hypothetical protein
MKELIRVIEEQLKQLLEGFLKQVKLLKKKSSSSLQGCRNFISGLVSRTFAL